MLARAAATLAVLVLSLSAAPASAHAELVSSDPANGARLDHPPARVTMRFTETINLVDGGLTLVGVDGGIVATPEPAASGRTITWPMPGDLPDGSYLVNWRVISADGHPVGGAFSFGVGAAAVSVDGSQADEPATAPWPVVVLRYGGYLAFAVLAGTLVFALWCSAAARREPRVRRLLVGSLVGGVVATLGSLLVQGPYVAAVSFRQTLDPGLLVETVSTPFGIALVWRIGVYLVLAAVVWRLHRFEVRPAGRVWLDGPVTLCVLGGSLTFAAAGHGAASGRAFDLVVDAAHVLAASVWVGGLAALVVLGRSVERQAVRRFSGFALLSVLVIVATGVLNSLRQLDELAQLWQTRYGALLLVKLAVVVVALAAAALSRSRLRHRRTPFGSVRVEAAAVVVVLAVTSALAMTSPPRPRGTGAAVDQRAAGGPVTPTRSDVTVRLPLDALGSAELHVSGTTTAGSDLHLLLRPERGIRITKATLQVSLPARDIGPIDVPLHRSTGALAGHFRFPLAGTWKTTLTAQDSALDAVVSAGELDVTAG